MLSFWNKKVDQYNEIKTMPNNRNVLRGAAEVILSENERLKAENKRLRERNNEMLNMLREVFECASGDEDYLDKLENIAFGSELKDLIKEIESDA